MIDFSKIDAAMLKRITNDPSEASGCIQSLIEKVARQKSWIENLEDVEEQRIDNNLATGKLMESMMEAFVFSPWYKRIWNAFRKKV